MTSMLRWLGPLLLTVAAACSPSGGGDDGGSDAPSGGDAGNGGCTFDDDCPNLGDKCLFAIDGGCTVAGRTGTCIAYSTPSSCTPNVACGCDGTTISVCAPAGYVDRASMSAGACPESDAGTDGGADASDDGASD